MRTFSFIIMTISKNIVDEVGPRMTSEKPGAQKVVSVVYLKKLAANGSK